MSAHRVLVEAKARIALVVKALLVPSPFPSLLLVFSSFTSLASPPPGALSLLLLLLLSRGFSSLHFPRPPPTSLLFLPLSRAACPAVRAGCL